MKVKSLTEIVEGYLNQYQGQFKLGKPIVASIFGYYSKYIRVILNNRKVRRNARLTLRIKELDLWIYLVVCFPLNKDGRLSQ